MLTAETILIGLLATALVIAPGYALARLLVPQHTPFLPVWGIAPALALALIPISWELVSWLGLRWTVIGAHVVTGVATVLVLAHAIRRRSTSPRPGEPGAPSARWLAVGLGGVLVVGLISRLAAIRDLVYPAWVDSPQHALIVRLLAIHGRVPDSFAPLMPEVTTFSYHFGFHANAVFVHWITGLSEADTLLYFGQILNALTPLSVYAFAVTLTRRPGMALLAAAISGLISVFPGYYVTWGRYTQLTGLLLLGPVMAVIVTALRPLPPAPAEPAAVPGAFARTNAQGTAVLRLGMLLAILISGLVLVHYRVLVFAVTFGVAALIVWPRINWRLWGLTAVMTAVLTGPWLWRLIQIWVAPRASDLTSFVSPGEYNRFPWEYFNSPLEIAWWSLAAFGAVAGLVRRDAAIWATCLWAGLTLGALNLPGGGTWLVNNNAWAITAFVAGSVSAAFGLAQLTEWVRGLWSPHPGLAQTLIRQTLAAVLAFWLGVGVIVGLVLGIRRQVNIINPITVLASPADRAALTWMRSQLPPDSVVAVNSFYWLDGIWSASDGGVWIWPATGLRTTTPPASYYFEPRWAVEINEWNARWATVREGNSPEALALLQQADVTHLYFGVRSGVLTADQFDDPRHFVRVYDQAGVVIIAVR